MNMSRRMNKRPKQLKIKMLTGERWYGGDVMNGNDMPYGKDSQFHCRVIEKRGGHNQVSSLLLSIFFIVGSLLPSSHFWKLVSFCAYSSTSFPTRLIAQVRMSGLICTLVAAISFPILNKDRINKWISQAFCENYTKITFNLILPHLQH